MQQRTKSHKERDKKTRANRQRKESNNVDMTVGALDACYVMRFHFGAFFTNTLKGQANIGYLTFSSRQSGSAVPGNKLADAGNLAQGHTH